jgi:diadenosine tetraphosphate (Ap4A) HIT family hydrolase
VASDGSKEPETKMTVGATLIHQRVAACRSGTYSKAICRVRSGWVVMGDVQFLKGYCLILPDPVVCHLNELNSDARRTLLHEASLVGDALLEITGAVRINYEILGNLEPALHVHIFPRFNDEPADLKTRPVWFYDWERAPIFDPERDAPLMLEIRSWLERAGVVP